MMRTPFLSWQRVSLRPPPIAWSHSPLRYAAALHVLSLIVGPRVVSAPGVLLAKETLLRCI